MLRLYSDAPRCAPLFLETDVGKIDLIVIVDNSGSVNALDATQTHAFCAPGDADWISVTLDADTTYTARTSNLAHDVDTVLELYASDGVTLLTQNDDSDGDSSSVTYTPAASGTYYIKLHHASATWGDASYSYHITLFEGYGGGGT